MREKGIKFSVFLRQGGSEFTLNDCEAKYTNVGKRVLRKRGRNITDTPSAQIWKVDCEACSVSAVVEGNPKTGLGNSLRELGFELCRGVKRPIRNIAT